MGIRAADGRAAIVRRPVAVPRFPAGPVGYLTGMPNLTTNRSKVWVAVVVAAIIAVVIILIVMYAGGSGGGGGGGTGY